MADIAIIGAGRLGTSLGRALAAKGHAIKAVTCRRTASARESRKIIGQGVSTTDTSAAARRGALIFLCLPDEDIPKAAAVLSRSRIEWRQKIVFHTSGLLPASVLKPLQNKGAATASFHPVQSFARKETSPGHFKGVYFGLEGDRKACRIGREIARELGGRAFLLSAETKPAYHAACAVASNFLVVLLDAAVHLLGQAGIEKNKAFSLLFPLVERTLQNVKKFDMPASLTGPVARGDHASVEAHLEALRRLPGYANAYKALSLLALEQAKARGLPPHKVRALKKLLGGKQPLHRARPQNLS
jgi:predicted short-subunit dehydrogenase-like oxidoreductase (DUF2520 family)